MRKVLAILLPALLILTACGGDTGSSGKAAGAVETLTSVKVSGGAEDAAPTVEFDSPLEITAPAAKNVAEGDGEVIEEGHEISFQAVFLNAEDGSVLGDTYEAGQPQKLQLTEQLKEVDGELYEVLVGSKVGSQIAYTRPLEATEGQPAAGPEQLIVLRVVSSKTPPPPPEVLTPEEVEKLDEDGQLPTLKFDDKGVPAVTIPENDPPADLVIKVLEEGTGEEITEADTISANYSGWTWDGEQFDSSFSRGEPSEFPLSGVIPGWTQGLAGQKAGAKVLLVIPTALAYNDQPGSPPGTLTFYVEIVEKVAAEK